MKIHCLQHVPFEGPAYIADWAKANGHEISYTRFWLNDTLPELEDFDWLLIMGGPMSVNDDDKLPWLAGEKQFITKCLEQDKTILGICLGAQLLAHCAGAKVYLNPHKEIGWFPVEPTLEGKLIFHLPENSTVFHWHGDTFDLPVGAMHLAQSTACSNQAFMLNNALGLQFHCEMTEDSLKQITEACADELVPDEYVQSAQEILDQACQCKQNNQLMELILDQLAVNTKVPLKEQH